MRYTHFLFLLIPAMIILISCDKDDPKPENPEEVLTTFRMTFSSDSTSEEVVFMYFDPDGEGGELPEIQGGTLEANSSYTATIEMLNEAINPADDIAAEVLEEGTEHQFFYAGTEGLTLSFGYLDMDENGNPIGLETKFLTGEPSTGTFLVILRHQPDKDAPGVSDGFYFNAGGETDIEIAFDMEIQ